MSNKNKCAHPSPPPPRRAVGCVCRYPGLKEHPSHDRAKRYFRPHMYGPVLSFGVRGGRDAGTSRQT